MTGFTNEDFPRSGFRGTLSHIAVNGILQCNRNRRGETAIERMVNHSRNWSL